MPSAGVVRDTRDLACYANQGFSEFIQSCAFTVARPLSLFAGLEVLTPPWVVKTLAHGYRPVVHPSAEARSG